MYKFLTVLFVAASTHVFSSPSVSPNQTQELSPLLDPSSLPYKISIVQADFQLPSNDVNSSGLQSFVYGTYHGKWILLMGRTNGLHSFNNGDNNFPPRRQNTDVYVVDPNNKTVVTRSLTDPSSALTQEQIDSLSVTAPQYHQVGNTLYLVGGYGVDTATGQFSTKSTLSVIDIPGLMRWVENPSSKESAAQYIRQTSHPLLQVTGGFLTQVNPHDPFLLILGQNFKGYYTNNSNGEYTKQIRPFKIIDTGKKLYVQSEKQFEPRDDYRRRDLNVIPIIQKGSKSLNSAVVALSGVFTEQTGVWTVPIIINADGSSYTQDLSNPTTFMQGMNNYDSARTGLFSKNTNDMFILVFGGLSYLYVEPDGSIGADTEVPFINSVTTIKIDSKGVFQQYLMENEYPVIPSQFANPGNTLLFGAEARFIRANNLPMFPNGVFSLDSLGSTPVVLGYIVGGIQSTVSNTFSPKIETASSPYIFSVIIERR